LTTIAAGNRTALNVLTSGRAGLPAYHPAGAYHTVAVALRPGKAKNRVGGISVRSARQEDLPAVLDFLQSLGNRRQFFPFLGASDFLTPDGAMRGLSFDMLLLAERQGRLIGTLAGWDQQSFRQSVVHSYSGWLRSCRPWYNAWARLRGLPELPQPGQVFQCLLGALPAVSEDDASVFAALVETLRNRVSGGRWSYLLIGLHEADPLLSVARRFQVACYVTHLFVVCWPDGEAARVEVDSRVPYLELGSL
jgi:hypothetical protein